MKRITVCSPQLGISPESNSGGEVYDREVINNLAKRGVEILTLLPKNRPFPKINNLTVCFAPIKAMFPAYIFNLFVFPYLIKAFKEYHVDILRVHSPYFVGPAAILFKRFFPKIPIVTSYLHLEEESFFQPFIDKILINKFNHLITISNFTKREIIKRYQTKEKKISVAYPGVSQNFKQKKKDERFLKKFNLLNKPVLLFLGGLKKRKNPLFLLDVLARLRDQKVILLVAGDGPLKRKMLLKSTELGIDDRVVLTGFISEKDKVNFYNLADIVLLPSKKEGFGMIATEAGACGKAVIASDNSSLPEVIKNGQTGFLAQTNNVDDWVKKINLLLENENLIKKIGFHAEKYVREKFSWEKNAKIHLEAFRKLLSSTSEVKKVTNE